MRSNLRLALSAMFTASAAPLLAADPVPKIGAPPAWVVAPELPPVDASKSDGPVEFLLSSSQERVTANGVENYVEYAAIPLNAAGLQVLGNVAVPWNVSRTDLTLHKIVIRRDGKDIDVLKPDEILVLRRENNLEKAVLDGIRTVVVPARGLAVGDTLSVAFSYQVRTSAVAKRPEEIQTLVAPLPIRRMERRFIIPDDVKVSWKIAPAIPKPTVSKTNGITEYRFLASDVAPVELPKYAPDRYKEPVIQVTGYSAWSEIAEQLKPLFDEARKLKADSPLIAEADKIAAGSADPGTRMLKALQLAQEKVRYVALLLGEGAYAPESADLTWERRFGDCKGKTALLLSLLDRFGIEAEPMLVSNKFDDRLGDQLPSLAMFDHVIVRARIGTATYFLDPTAYGQRTLSELTIPVFSHGLALRPEASLDVLPQGTLEGPVKELSVTWDASTEKDGEYPFDAVLRLRGSEAAEMRAKLAAATDVEKFNEQLENMVPMIENDDLVIAEKAPESSDGSFVVTFKGSAEMDWSPFEGKRETRFAFSNSAIQWDPEFDRDEGYGKDWPVFIGARPYWERLVETVILPAGGKGYSLDGERIDSPVAGSIVKRSLELADGRATMTSDFHHLKREISADDARAAVPILEKIRGNYAYVVGPPERKRQ